jgi:hypothetical protein
MSDVAQVPAMSSAMVAAIEVMRAAQQMAASTAALMAVSAAGPEQRAPLPYSQMLDKLA